VPLYEYQCQKCLKRTEKIESVSGPHLKKCPHCGGKVERLHSAPAIQFKGTGWYVTDYAGKSNAKEPGPGGPEKGGAEKKDLAGGESSAKESPKETKESKETKPAKKK
jgi:putative FmdB family regulatory protein